ncbi:hypothetical protein ABZP36_003032 [Zizania latifolia]
MHRALEVELTAQLRHGYPCNMKVILQLGLVIVLFVSQYAPATSVPSSDCQRQCGHIDMEYPFGIGPSCSLNGGFDINCSNQNGVSKPFIGDFELHSISITEGTIRVLTGIRTYCYNTFTKLMDINTLTGFDGTDTPYRLSDIHNKFTVIGCSTLAYISGKGGRPYQSGCVSTCSDMSDLVDGSCSGMGCCQTAIPKNMSYYVVGFDSGFNTSQIWMSTGRCSYAVLMEADKFNFSTTYINTTEFNDTNVGRAPMVLDWALRDFPSCDTAKQNVTGTYACVSSNSVCVDSRNDNGYQ